MNRLKGKRPNRIRASARRKTTSPSWSTVFPHASHCFISGVIGIGSIAPDCRAFVAAGPHGLPCQEGGTSRSVGSLPSWPNRTVTHQTKVHMDEILKFIFLGRTAPAPPGLAERLQRGDPAGSFGGRNRGREQGRAYSRVALRPAIRKSPIMMSFGSSLINRDTPNYPILWIFTGAPVGAV